MNITETTTEETCGCKGIRFCHLCADSDRVKRLKMEEISFDYTNKIPFVYCQYCQLAHRLSEQRRYSYEELLEVAKNQNLCEQEDSLAIDKVVYIPDFISLTEEAQLVDLFDQMEWKLSQSGRRKQEWGPKVNFKVNNLIPA